MLIWQVLGGIWNYFKKGRNEIGLILGLYSMILSYSIKFDIDFTIKEYLVFSVVFFVGCAVLGVFLAEKIDPELVRINPQSQDNIKSTIALQNSLIAFYNGDFEGAKEYMNQARKLRIKWLR